MRVFAIAQVRMMRRRKEMRQEAGRDMLDLKTALLFFWEQTALRRYRIGA